MRSLSREEIGMVSRELELQGITFEPLRSELLDHLICDIEMKMQAGMEFPAAWKAVQKDIPENHFNTLQIESMKAFSKKLNPERAFGILSIVLLASAALFKLLHLAGGAYLILAFLFAASVTLLTGAARSSYVYRESKGQASIIAASIVIVLFITGLCFNLLGLQGAGMLLQVSVISMCILFPSFSIYFYRSRQQLKDSLIIKLTDDSRGTVEKITLILLGFGLVFNYSALLTGEQTAGGVIFFIFSVILAALYAYSLTWQHYIRMPERQHRTDLLLLISSSMAFIMFMLPALGPRLPEVLRLILAHGSVVIFIVILMVYYYRYSAPAPKQGLAVASGILLTYPLFRLFAGLHLLPEVWSGLTVNPVFNVSFLVLMAILLIAFRKEKPFKALIMLLVAIHMIPHL